MKLITFFLFLSLPFNLLAVRGDLSPAETLTLQSGKLVKRVINVKGESWPRVTIISIIPHAPKKNMITFLDFEKHKNFIPDLIKSKIIKKEGNIIDVAFEMKMPWPLGNSVYSTRHVLENLGQDYKLTWSLIKSNQMKSSDGSIVFEAHEGKTLFTYTNHIIPDSSFAGLFKDRVEGDTEKTVKIIIKYLAK